MDFAGKTALVTGGTRGIGAAIAAAFSSRGASVIITGRDERALERVSQQCPEYQCIQADFADNASVAEFVAKIDALEGLDICVNNAGINELAPVAQLDVDAVDKIHAVNLRAPQLICAAAVRIMQRRGWGRIVNVASIWSVITKAQRSLYTASKFGLVGFTKTAAVENAAHNILINAISPGFVDTELTRSTLSPEQRAELAAQVPMGRFANTEEIASTVIFLCSELNTYLTGQNIVVDGGFVCA